MELRQSNAARGHKLTNLSISVQELEDLDFQAKAAQANYQQALAACDNAKINLDRTIVYSPVNGYVTNLVLDEGDFADVGKPVLAILVNDRFGQRACAGQIPPRSPAAATGERNRAECQSDRASRSHPQADHFQRFNRCEVLDRGGQQRIGNELN
jgi:multidrug efflux pump subunit AcrA (membrane-fusion protein)